MKKLLALVFALLAGSAFGADGWMVDGVCFDTISKAGNALALSRSSIASDYKVVSATYHVRSLMTAACSATATNAATGSVTLQCSQRVSGSTSTSAAGAQTPFTQLQSGVGGFTTSLPVCAQSASMTAADGVSLGWQVGGIWIAIAAVLFMAATIKRFT